MGGGTTFLVVAAPVELVLTSWWSVNANCIIGPQLSWGGEMKAKAERWIVLVLLGLTGSLVQGGALAGETQFVDGLGPVTFEGGLWTITVDEETTVQTHGLDPEGDLPRITSPQGTKESIACAGNRQKHFEGIVARAADDVDRFAELVPKMRRAIYDASAYLNAEASRVSATAVAKYPVLCDSAGEAIVHEVVLETSKLSDSASSIIGDLWRLGFRSSVAKYLIFYDDCAGESCATGGVATINRDDRASAQNANNSGPDFAIDFGSSLDAPPSWSTILHESGHNMGAVQLSAPHSSGYSETLKNGFHCNDGQDVMCYADGGDQSAYFPLACLEERFDCNNDDYFNPLASGTEYLANHWNLAASYNEFLVHSSSSSGPGKGGGKKTRNPKGD